MREQRHRAVALCCMAAVASWSCSGSIEPGNWRGPGAANPQSGGPSDYVPGATAGAASIPAGGSGAAGRGNQGGSAAPALGTFVPAPAALRRLSTAQYQSSVRHLLGDVELTVELDADTSLNGFVAIGQARATISPAAMEKYESAAFELAAQAVAPDRREKFVGCAPKGVTDATCTRAFLTRFGRRAFRRPLTGEELTRYLGVAENAAGTLDDFYAGIEFAVAGLLQSPNFLFRVELGEPDPADPSRLRYTGYEMASRLSFLFWNEMPDDALLDAAEAGELLTTAGIMAQVERLMTDPRTRVAMNTFHAERLGLDALDSLAKDEDLYPAMSETLGAAMRVDILRTLEDLTFGTPGDYRDVFDTRVAFVDRELAGIYGVTAPASGTARVELPDGLRLGLLGKAGLLAQNAHIRETSPTLRGKFVRERVLCQSIPAPPANVVTTIPEPNPDAPTMRERLAAHREVDSCAGCHVLMDPIGLAFENFDALGVFRATDDGHALDTSGDIDGMLFQDPRELAEVLREMPGVSECLVRQLYRYAVAHVETAGENPVIVGLAQRFESSGRKFPELLRAVVVSDGFRYAVKEAP